MECSLNECGVCGSESVVAFCKNCNFRICENCFHMHRRSTKLFHNHVAFLIETTKPTLHQTIAGDDAREVSKQNSGDVHTLKCTTHTTENVIFFCSDHSYTLCGRCVVSSHKSCKIVDLFDVNVNDEEINTCTSHLRDLEEKLKSAANKIDQNTTYNQTCKDVFLNELQQVRADVNTWFDRLQSKYETHCSETFDTNNERFTKVQTVCNELMKRIEEHQESINTLLKQNHVKQLYILLNKVEQEIVEINSKLNLLEIESSFNEYKFKRSSGIQQLLNDTMFDIGDLDELCSGSDEISEGELSSITIADTKTRKYEFMKEYSIYSIKVYVYQASICDLPVDCIVNAANDRLSHGDGVARAIAMSAGDELTKEGNKYIRSNGPICVGKVAVTTAGNLKYKCVIHAVGPIWSDYDTGTQDGVSKFGFDLYHAVFESVFTANASSMKSVALPPISSAIFGVPIRYCTMKYARAVLDFCILNKNDTCLREIHFVDVNEETVKDIQYMFDCMIRDMKPEPYQPSDFLPKSQSRRGHGGYMPADTSSTPKNQQQSLSTKQSDFRTVKIQTNKKK
ncbi:hypothetical protein DPMN_133536 [Dreissena polymorpha]|uniref:B box-type domain-containing protein n=1 Tax=Dreissena polymorpha TaxID=45954 RepID=A0A9D4FTS4_DREPO|nr:hypothetical protein DPMN_133536 [Dreissena polymorpha]